MNNWVDNRAVNEMGKLVVQFGIQVKKSTRLENWVEKSRDKIWTLLIPSYRNLESG